MRGMDVGLLFAIIFAIVFIALLMVFGFGQITNMFCFNGVAQVDKAVKDLEPVHFSIVRSYMKANNVGSGLLLNFGAMPLTVKRVGREHPKPS